MPPDTVRPRLFFYVQHLLGIGHLHRAARIAAASAAAGFEVRLVLGGLPSPGLPIGGAVPLRLPPVKAGVSGFSVLVHPDGRPFEVADRERRRDLLLEAFETFAPDVLVTEAFPFGRRQMRFELMPLLERARARARPPLVAASVRDILQRDTRQNRIEETLALVERFYDLVLVHGDPGLARLEQSFPGAHRCARKLVYTGLVAPDPVVPRTPEFGAVVSAGGGVVGYPLLAAALQARRLTSLAGQPWLVLTGPNLPPDSAALLERSGDALLQVERFVPDLAGILARAAVSVSQAGYNTVADVLAGGCRAVLVPFAQGGETEQTDRAALLEQRGSVVVLGEDRLRPIELAAAIEEALALPPERPRFDLGGASATARILRERCADRQAGTAS